MTREEARARAVQVLTEMAAPISGPHWSWVVEALEAAGLNIISAAELERLDAAEQFAQEQTPRNFIVWRRLRDGASK